MPLQGVGAPLSQPLLSVSCLALQSASQDKDLAQLIRSAVARVQRQAQGLPRVADFERIQTDGGTGDPLSGQRAYSHSLPVAQSLVLWSVSVLYSHTLPLTPSLVLWSASVLYSYTRPLTPSLVLKSASVFPRTPS